MDMHFLLSTTGPVNVIAGPTRAELIAEGHLVVIDPVIRRIFGLRIPTAITATAMTSIRAVEGCPDRIGRLFVTLLHAREAAKRSRTASEVNFTVPADPDDPESLPVAITFHVGFDEGQPVFTLYLLGEG